MKAIRIISALAVLFMYSIVAGTSFATVNDDQVTSQKIKEADGTSGQNTNSGSGIKTGHIQNNAVTTTKIQDGAVTDAKITGPISASKIATAGLNADTVDGKHASDLQQKYGRVAVVALTGGDYSDPVTAANDYDTWCPSGGPTNPCLLKIMPGVYDIGTNVLALRPGMDMEGSGENATIIKGAGGSGYALNAGQVLMQIYPGANEVRSLTVENYGPGIYGSTMTGIYGVTRLKNVTVNMFPPSGSMMWPTGISVSGPLEFTNVKVLADAGANQVRSLSGIDVGYTTGSAEFNNVTVTLKGTNVTSQSIGIKTDGVSSVKIKNSEINVTVPVTATGLYTRSFSGAGSDITVTDSVINSSWFGILAHGDIFRLDHSSVSAGSVSITYLSPAVRVAYSKIVGPLSNGGGQITCIGTYDGSYSPFSCTTP